MCGFNLYQHNFRAFSDLFTTSIGFRLEPGLALYFRVVNHFYNLALHSGYSAQKNFDKLFFATMSKFPIVLY